MYFTFIILFNCKKKKEKMIYILINSESKINIIAFAYAIKLYFMVQKIDIII